MDELISRKKLNAVMTAAPNILQPRALGSFQRVYFFPPSQGGRDSESCFLFHTLGYSQLSRLGLAPSD